MTSINYIVTIILSLVFKVKKEKRPVMIATILSLARASTIPESCNLQNIKNCTFHGNL